MKTIIDASVFYNEKEAPVILGNSLRPFLNKDTIVICIGTDKCIGDSLGPIVGTLIEKEELPITLYGTLDNPIHAVNLKEKLKNIKELHPSNFTIAIDACLGSKENTGKIQVKFGPIHPGKGVGKKLTSVGDVSIVGVVDTIGSSNNISLHNIRLSFIMKLAEAIVEGFKYALYE